MDRDTMKLLFLLLFFSFLIIVRKPFVREAIAAQKRFLGIESDPALSERVALVLNFCAIVFVFLILIGVIPIRGCGRPLA